jgi:hypothetical protein
MGADVTGIVTVVPPAIGEADLVFNEAETRQILVFFWPNVSAEIDAVTINDVARRFAQELLISAIDASYAMGFVDVLFNVLSKPHKGLKSLGQKLARRYVQHWWRHTKPKDLQDVQIYESVRRTIALNFATKMNLFLKTGELSLLRLPPIQLAVQRWPGAGA